jgi:transglutaminase-like putative cysteine protease
VTFTVIPADYREPSILSPVAPTEVDEKVVVVTTGDADYFARVDRDGGEGAYDVTAEVRVRGDGPGELNESALRATPTAYPAEIERLYLQLPDEIIGDNAKKLELEIAEKAGSPAPIDLADAAVSVLGSSEFDYDIDIRDIDCGSTSYVECFATYKRGFCQYYAITMAAILRDLGVPTRIAGGFLPGSRDRSGTEVIDSASIHEWVEVYFPGYGWVEFDPTPASVSQLAPLPTGPPQASSSPGAAASAIAQPSRFDPRINEDPNAPSGSVLGSGGPGSLGPLVAVGLLLLIVVVGLAFLAWQRGPRGPTNVEGAYGMVIRIASRLGFKPRPAETVYEYAGALGDVLPDVRPELQTVAQAKVESVYGRQLLSEERLAAINAAQRRLRVGLFRLAFRRRERGRR